MIRQQKLRGFLSPEQRTRDGRLRAAWLGIVHPLKCRPEPRGPWDGASRDTCPTTPWEPMQGNVRNAVQAAVETRNPHVINAVEKRVQVYYAMLCADALAPIPRSPECVLELSQSVTRESAEASVAMQRVLAELPAPSLSTIEAAVAEATESRSVTTKCYDFLNELLHRHGRASLRIQA